jgi:hypothetical protein
LTSYRQPDGAALLDDVYKFLGRFIVYPSEPARVAHTLWVEHTHVMDAWESTPRIAFLSAEKGSGKTRAMEITELLVPNPVLAINVTPAYLFRKVGDEDGAPTVLFDEIDCVFGPKAKENEEVRALINSGHRRGAHAGRCVARGSIILTEEIPSYCAVALAGLGWLPDTILSRSVIVRMRRRAPDEPIEPYRRREHAQAGHALRDRLAAWGVAILDEATGARPEMPAGVADRDADCWEPLLAIADIGGGDWPAKARAAAVELVKIGREASPSLNLRLAADLRKIFGKAEALHTRAILEKLRALDDAPWNDTDNKGKVIDSNQLSHRLRQYGVGPKNVTVEGVQAKGYAAADLADIWRRYLPPPSPDLAVQAVQPSGTLDLLGKNGSSPDGSRTARTATPPSGAVEPSAEKPNETGAFNSPPDGRTARTAFPGDGRGHPLREGNGADRTVAAPPLTGTGGGCRQCNAPADGSELTHAIDGKSFVLHRECEPFFRSEVYRR